MYTLNEITFNGYSVYSLDLLYTMALILGIFVIISKNPIVSVLFLIGLFLSISCYLILTGLNFIGLSYLLLYIVAIWILFLFILMIINVRVSELFLDSINSIPLALLVGKTRNIYNYATHTHSKTLSVYPLFITGIIDEIPFEVIITVPGPNIESMITAAA